MSTEKMYRLAVSACIEYAAAIGAEDPEKLAESAIRSGTDLASCYQLAHALREDLEKRAGRGSTLSAAKRIIKNAQKLGRPAAYQGAWQISEGQCICDGYRGAILRDPLACLPLAEEGQRLDLAHIIATARKEQEISEFLPSLAQIKTTLADLKAAHPEAYTRGKAGIAVKIAGCGTCVNPEYLRDMVELFPDARVYTANNNALSPIIFESPAGVGILLPVRLKDTSAAPTLPQRGAAA